MKKEILKIITIFIITIGVVLWVLNFILFNNNAPKSKATGETMNLSFTPATQTAASNTDFTVTILAKPSIHTVLRGYKTKVNFDKTKLAFKSIQYKVGVVSAGLGNTTADIATINSSGFVNIVGEDTTVIGNTLTAVNGAELVSLTFMALTTTGTTVTMTDSSFYSINSDMSLFDSWTATVANLTINGGGTNLLTITPGGLTLTPMLSPTMSTGNVNLKMKLKFQGIAKLPAAGENSMLIKAKVYKEGVITPVEGSGTFTSDSSGLWSGTISVNLTTVAGKYRILIKGSHQIQKRICDSVPTETSSGTYRCSNGDISLTVGDNDLNFSGILLLAGDLDQNGLVDSVDFGLVRNNLGKTDAATLAISDINRDGIVNTQDFSMILVALGIRTDEL